MNNLSQGWLWLSLIAGAFLALALGATFLPEMFNRPIGQGPATWGLFASTAYLVFVIAVMSLAIRPFKRVDRETD